MIDIITLILKSILFIMVGTFIFIIPGWAIFGLVWESWKEKVFLEKVGLSVGLSLAIYPLLFLWLGLFHIDLGIIFSVLPGFIGTLVILATFYRNYSPGTIHADYERRKFFGNAPSKSISQALTKKNWLLFIKSNSAFLISLLIIFLLILSRLNNLRAIDIPMWGDSYQHTVIAQLFFENNGLFKTWFPYTPYVSFTVQYGFSSLVTVFMWITRINSPTSALVVGQLVNILAILSIYPIAYKLSGKNTLAAIISVTLAGLISTLPGGYINWGRYAQLTGLAILPVPLYLTYDLITILLIKFSRNSFQIIQIKPFVAKTFVISVILTGMILSYYRLFLFYTAFILSLLIILGIFKRTLSRLNIVPVFLCFSLIVVFSAILFFPWLVNVQGGSLADKVEIGVTGQSPTLNHLIEEYQVWKDILTYIPFGLIILFFTGWAWSFRKKEWHIFGIGLWSLILSALVLFKYLRIPTAYFAQNFSVIISLYIPISIVGGWFLSEIVDKTKNLKINNTLLQSLFILISIVAVTWGTLHQSKIANPDFYALVTQEDLRAINYIKNNVPIDSLFLVEAMSIPPGDSIIGNDAGWWLPLLARRENLVPPQYAHLNERPAEPDYNQRIVNLVRILEEKPIPSSESIDILCEEGITHAYIGQKEGKVSFGNQPLFTEDQLLQSSLFIPIFKHSRVRIFQFNQSVCDAR